MGTISHSVALTNLLRKGLSLFYQVFNIFFLFSSMKYEILHIVLFVYIFIHTNATWWRTFEASMKTNRRRQEDEEKAKEAEANQTRD